MQKIIIRKSISILVVLALFLTMGPLPGALAVEAQSKSVKLTSYTGEFTIKKDSTTLTKIKEGMRIFDGYNVITGSDSAAFLELDNTKFVKMDQNTDLKIKKNGKKNDLLLNSGALFFNVTKPLLPDETLKVKTSNMTMGVRGTTGAVLSRPTYDSAGQLVSLNVEVQIYTGAGYVTWKNETTGAQGAQTIAPGHSMAMTVNTATGVVTTAQTQISANGQSIPAVALAELVKMDDVLAQIKAITQIDVSALPNALTINRGEEQQKNKANEAVIQKAQDTFAKANEGKGSYGGVIGGTDQDQPAPEENPPSNGGESSGGNEPDEPDTDPGDDTSVAIKIGDQSFANLEAALAAADKLGTTTITLSAGKLDLGMGLSIKQDVVLEALGKVAITNTNSNDLAAMVTVKKEGKLTLKGDLTLDGQKKGYVAKVNAEAELIMETGATLTGGQADQGGGVYNTGTLTLNGGVISGNKATDGGGVYNAGTLMMNTGGIFGNTAENDGGGIYNAGILMFSAGTLSGNQAKNGGGVYGGETAKGMKSTMVLSSGVIETNEASLGQGIYLDKGSFEMAVAAQIATDNTIYLAQNQVIGIRGSEVEIGLITAPIVTVVPDNYLVGRQIAYKLPSVAVPGWERLVTIMPAKVGEVTTNWHLDAVGLLAISEAGYQEHDNSPIMVYETWQEAFARANIRGGRVTILKDVQLKDTLEIVSKRGITLDSSGAYTITWDSEAVDPDKIADLSMFKIDEDGALTLEGGLIINGTLQRSGASVSETKSIILNAGTFTMNGGTLTGGRVAADGGAIMNKGTCTINGGEIKNNTALVVGGGIYNDKTGELVIKGSSVITNNSAIEKGGGIYNHGALTIDGGSFSENSTTKTLGNNIYNTFSSAYKDNSVPAITDVMKATSALKKENTPTRAN